MSLPDSNDQQCNDQKDKDQEGNDQRAILKANQIPPPGSFHILITESSNSLYMLPIIWESDTLFAIGCTASDLTLFSTNTHDSDFGHATDPEKYPAPTFFEKALDMLKLSTINKHREIEIRNLFPSLMETIRPLENTYKSNPFELPIWYHKKPVAIVQCPWLAKEAKTGRPMCAFVDQNWLLKKRRSYFSTLNLSLSKANTRIESIRSSTIDPYYAATLITMAQECRLVSQKYQRRVQEPYFFPVHLLTPSTDRKALVHYSSNISVEYLKKFDCPNTRFDCSLHITWHEIPLHWAPEKIIQNLRQAFNVTKVASIKNNDQLEGWHIW